MVLVLPMVLCQGMEPATVFLQVGVEKFETTSTDLGPCATLIEKGMDQRQTTS